MIRHNIGHPIHGIMCPKQHHWLSNLCIINRATLPNLHCHFLKELQKWNYPLKFCDLYRLNSPLNLLEFTFCSSLSSGALDSSILTRIFTTGSIRLFEVCTNCAKASVNSLSLTSVVFSWNLYCINRVMIHMTCYNFEYSHWWKFI